MSQLAANASRTVAENFSGTKADVVACFGGSLATVNRRLKDGSLGKWKMGARVIIDEVHIIALITKGGRHGAKAFGTEEEVRAKWRAYCSQRDGNGSTPRPYPLPGRSGEGDEIKTGLARALDELSIMRAAFNKFFPGALETVATAVKASASSHAGIGPVHATVSVFEKEKAA